MCIMAKIILVTLLMCIMYSGGNNLALTEKRMPDKFECNSHNSTRYSELRIENGVTDKQIKDCLETSNYTEALLLRNSHLSSIPKYLDTMVNIEYIDLSYNAITEVTFEGIESICQHLTHLLLNNNNIEVLQKGDLDCLQSLQYLYLGNNNLRYVENGTFSEKMKSIKYIDLGNNSLTVLDLSLLSKLKLSHNMNLVINASRNFITGVTNSANITINDFTTKTAVAIIATHNNFTTFNIKHYFQLLNVTGTVQLLRLWTCGFDLRFNPFICDCALVTNADLLRRFWHMNPHIPIFSVTCGSPPSLAGMLVRNVPTDQFNCPVELNCPNKCICNKTDALGLVTIHCDEKYIENNLPKTCPKAKRINLNIKSNKLTTLSSREYLRNVSQFDVSHCAITYIETSFVDMIQYASFDALLLNDNRLETIPRSFENLNFSNGQVLALDGNPFICDCHSRWMKMWLRLNKKHILRRNNTRCATGPGKGKPIHEVPDNLFICQTFTKDKSKDQKGNGRMLQLLSVIGSITFLALLLVILWRKSKSIQVFMISHFDICKYCCRKRKHRQLSYDIFIPHSCEDDDVI